MKSVFSVLICLTLLFLYYPAAVRAEETGNDLTADTDNSAAEDETSGDDALRDDEDGSDAGQEHEEDASFNAEEVTGEVVPAGPLEMSLATASEQDPDVVKDWRELEEWLDDHYYTGGTVTLGADIDVTGDCCLATRGDDSLIINTGPYGFIVTDTGCIDLREDVNITGHGTPSPVIQVCGGGELLIYGTCYESAPTITVTEENGIGVKLESGAEYYGMLSSFMRYQAEGDGSTAIVSEAALDLHDHYIKAIGSGANGIVSTAPVSLYLSSVTAGAASIISTDVITLDTCVVSPEVIEAEIINRKISKISIKLQDVFTMGSKTNGYFSQDSFFSTVTLSAEDVPDTDFSVYLTFDDSNVDYNTPGRYYMPLYDPLPVPYNAFDLVSAENPNTFAIDVIDPSIPFLREMKFSFMGGGYIIYHVYTGNLDDLTLWRTDNDGENWYVYWKYEDEDELNQNFVVVPDENMYGVAGLSIIIRNELEFQSPAWLVYEVGKGRGSSLFYVDLAEIKTGGAGGDRDGGDRIQKPWEFFTGNPKDENGETGDGSDDSETDTSKPGLDGGMYPGGYDNTGNGGRTRGGNNNDAVNAAALFGTNGTNPVSLVFLPDSGADGISRVPLGYSGANSAGDASAEQQDVIISPVINEAAPVDSQDTVSAETSAGEDTTVPQEPPQENNLILEPPNPFAPSEEAVNRTDSAIGMNEAAENAADSLYDENTALAQADSKEPHTPQTLLTSLPSEQNNTRGASASFPYITAAACAAGVGVTAGLAYAFLRKKAFSHK